MRLRALAVLGLVLSPACSDPAPVTPAEPTVAIAPGPPTAPAAVAPEAPPRTPLELTNATITDAARALAGATGRSIAIDPHAQELADCARITLISPAQATPDEVLALTARALDGSGLALESEGDGLIIRRQSDAELPAGCREAPADRASAGRSDPGRLGIRAVSAVSYQVTYDTRDRLMNQPSVLPRVVGQRLYGIRAHGPFAALGLRNGDTVRAINGASLSTPELALEAYARLRAQSTWRVEIERNGAPMTLTYQFVDQLSD